MNTRSPFRHFARTAVAVAVFTVTSGAVAQSAPPTDRHALDPRHELKLAPARVDNWRCQMRGHLRTLTDAMRELAAGNYEAAATAVDDNFGLSPGGQEYCREPMFTREESVTDSRLPPSPPPEVRAMFELMHAAAREFSANARQIGSGGDVTKAWNSLASLGGTCTACHAVYRLD